MSCLSYSSEIKIWDISNVVITAVGIRLVAATVVPVVVAKRVRYSSGWDSTGISLTPQSALAVTVTAVHVVETIPRSVSIQKRFPQEEMNRREELADMLKTTFVEAIRRALRSGGEEGLAADSKIARVYEFIEEALELEASRRHLSVETILASIL